MITTLTVCILASAPSAATVPLPASAHCPPCPLDWDQSGGVDGDDIAAYIRDWEMGEPCADFDRSGGIDVEDIAAFWHCFQLCSC